MIPYALHFKYRSECCFFQAIKHLVFITQALGSLLERFEENIGFSKRELWHDFEFQTFKDVSLPGPYVPRRETAMPSVSQKLAHKDRSRVFKLRCNEDCSQSCQIEFIFRSWACFALLISIHHVHINRNSTFLQYQRMQISNSWPTYLGNILTPD